MLESPGPDSENDSAARSLIETGAEMAGGAAGTALGMLLGGGAGAIAGAVTGPVAVRGFLHVAREFQRRVLSPRESERVGATLSFAFEEIKRRLDAGDTPRTDAAFAQEDSRGHTSAHEVLEGTLVVAQRSYEERKIPFLGKLVATIAFDPTISAPTAHALLRLMDALTYRQLVLLSVIHSNGPENRFGMRDTMYGPGRTGETPAITHEIYDLYQRALVWQHDYGSDIGDAVLSADQIRPRYLELEGMGSILFRAARLDTVATLDLLALARELGDPVIAPHSSA